MKRYIFEQGFINSKPNRDFVLDSLKGIAMIGVVMAHVNVFFRTIETGAKLQDQRNILETVFAYGARGCQLFLIISGFLCYRSYSEYLQKDEARWYKWVASHIVRIIPMYYFGLVLSLIVFGLKDIKCIIVHLLLLQGLFPQYDNAINLSWFLGVIVIEYAFVPIFHRFIKSLKQSIIVLSVLVPICDLTHWIIGNNSQFPTYWKTYSFTYNLPSIIMGIVLYYLLTNERIMSLLDKSQISNNVFRAILILLSYICLVGLEWRDNQLLSNDKYLWSGLFLITIFLLKHYQSPIFINVCNSFIGRHTLGIYLIHFSVLGLFCNYSSIKLRDCPQYIMYLSALLLAIIISSVLTIIVEKTEFVIKRIIHNNRI